MSYDGYGCNTRMKTTSPGRLRRYREQEDSEPLLARRLAWQNEPSYRLRKKAWLVQRPSRTYLYCTRHDLLYLIAGPTSLSLNLKILPSIPQLVWQRQIPTTPTALGMSRREREDEEGAAMTKTLYTKTIVHSSINAYQHS